MIVEKVLETAWDLSIKEMHEKVQQYQKTGVDAYITITPLIVVKVPIGVMQ